MVYYCMRLDVEWFQLDDVKVAVGTASRSKRAWGTDIPCPRSRLLPPSAVVSTPR